MIDLSISVKFMLETNDFYRLFPPAESVARYVTFPYAFDCTRGASTASATCILSIVHSTKSIYLCRLLRNLKVAKAPTTETI